MRKVGLVVAVAALAVIAVFVLVSPQVVVSIRTNESSYGGCALMEVQGTLHGDRSALPHVWLDTPGNAHLEVIWPYGYSARFASRLELLDRRSTVVAREGDVVSLGGTGDPWYACDSPPQILRHASE